MNPHNSGQALFFMGKTVSPSERGSLEELRSKFTLVRDELARMTENNQRPTLDEVDRILGKLPFSGFAREVLGFFIITTRSINVSGDFHLERNEELVVPEIIEVDPVACLSIEPELFLAP